MDDSPQNFRAFAAGRSRSFLGPRPTAQMRPQSTPEASHSQGRMGLELREGSLSQSTHVRESEASVSTRMSIEEFVQQPGRDNLPKLHPRRPNGTTWFDISSNGISKSINRMLHGLVKHPYSKFKEMPFDEQEIWFRQFAQDFTWDIQNHGLVRQEFYKKARDQYRHQIHEWKQCWIHGTVAKGFVHKTAVWEGFVKHWESEETKADARKHKANRMSNRGGLGHSTHNAGAQSVATIEETLAKKLGKRPSHVDVMKEVHTNKRTGLIQDPVARNLVESVTQAAEEYRQSQEFLDSQTEGAESNEVSVEKLNQIYEELSTRSKGRVFGRPKDHRTATSRFSEEADIRALLEEKTARMAELEEEVSLVKEASKKDIEDLKRNMEEQMEAKMEAKMEAMMATMRKEFGGNS